jgi:hypothetical protein
MPLLSDAQVIATEVARTGLMTELISGARRHQSRKI